MIDTSYSTIAGLALRVIEDYNTLPLMGAGTRYTLQQALFKVCHERETIASCLDGVPSYIWWHIGLDRYSEISPVVDLGKLATVPLDDRRQRYVWPREQMEDSGAWEMVLGQNYTYSGMSPLYAMMEHGLSLGTQVCTRFLAEWHQCSYEYDDWDTTINSEVVFIDRSRVIDIPLSEVNIAPEFRGLRYA